MTRTLGIKGISFLLTAFLSMAQAADDACVNLVKSRVVISDAATEYPIHVTVRVFGEQNTNYHGNSGYILEYLPDEVSFQSLRKTSCMISSVDAVDNLVIINVSDKHNQLIGFSALTLPDLPVIMDPSVYALVLDINIKKDKNRIDCLSSYELEVESNASSPSLSSMDAQPSTAITKIEKNRYRSESM
ncbi:MAG: hypothetical protein KF798_07300 [Candidatus Paracaedibacteraceae bacterium]|nr:hypothetical protein [Candidatus Paracaedibacteraceae bacterium]